MHDFRRLPDAEARLWSPELHGEYRRARDQRDIALEIADLAPEPIPQTWRLPEPLPDDDEELAAMARRNLIEVAPVRFPLVATSSPIWDSGLPPSRRPVFWSSRPRA